MTADQARCLPLPPTFAASVLCVAVRVFVCWLCVLWDGNMFVFVTQCSRKLHRHMEQSNACGRVTSSSTHHFGSVCAAQLIDCVYSKNCSVMALREKYYDINILLRNTFEPEVEGCDIKVICPFTTAPFIIYLRF